MRDRPDGFLGALQLADSFFPSGAYALSHGLETAVEDGRVGDAAGLEAWLRALIVGQIGPIDGVVVGAAWEASAVGAIDRLRALDCWLEALRLAREGRDVSRRMGRRLLETGRRLLADEAPPSLDLYRTAVLAGEAPGHHPVALGVVSEAMGLGRASAVAVTLYSAATSILGAGLRVLRVDHETSQAILFRLQPVLAATTRRCLDQPWQEAWSACPEAEICAMRHERATRHLFAT